MEGDNTNLKKLNSETYASQSLDTNTSILDFKSPKIKPIDEIKLFSYESTRFKKRQAQLKINSDNIIENKASSSKQMQRHISNDVYMQTVSSISCDQEDESTSLPCNNKIAYVCPLCFKNYKDNNSRISHMKNCATKNKVSTKKLLQAMEIQERQAAERVSLGLPGAPMLQNKKQTLIQRTAINQDSQLQLALALSKSLYEIKEIKNNTETEQDFIISSTKNSVENITRRIQRKKKQNITSVLQIRSQEERDRLLTEKIAEILVDSETLIKRHQQAKNENESKKKDNLRSDVLKKLLNFNNQLWNAAMLQLNQTDFFVKCLSSYIIPSVEKQRSMENINEINVINELQLKDKLAITCDPRSDKEESLNISHRMDVKLFKDQKENIKQSCINNLIVDWGNALNNSSSSDVIIFVDGGKHIWVHKLVFHVRCPNILLDLIPNENTVYLVKEKICWTDIKHYIALAFLEFIYCGIIEKYPIFSNDNIAISSLGCLARKYKVKELFPYLRRAYAISHHSTSMDNELEINEQGIQEIYYANDEENKLTLAPDRDSNVVKCSNQDAFDVPTTSQNQLLTINMLSPEKCTIPSSLIDRENSTSPDIFDDIGNITLNHADNTTLMHIEKSKNNIEHDRSSPNQHNWKNVASNQWLSPSLTNTNKNSTNKYTLMESVMTTPRINQTEQVTDKVKIKSDLTLFIEEVQKENDKSDSEEYSKIGSPSKLFIRYNKNPFKKADYSESSIILNRFDNDDCSPKAAEKVSHLSKLESDMQIYAIENPHMCNITIDENLKFTKPGNRDHTDLSSPTTKVNISIACDDKPETLEKSVQENNVSMTTSYCSSSEMDTDDANISKYTKYKRKHINNSIDIYRSAVKKHKNNIIEIENDKSKNNEIIMSDCASNFSNITKCAYYINNTINNHFNVSSLSNMTMDKNFRIIQVEENISNLESRNETELCNTSRDNVTRSAESLKMRESANRNYDKLIISCDSNNLKTQITSDKSFKDTALESSPLQIYGKHRKLRKKRSRSEGSLQYNYNNEKDYEIYWFDNIFLQEWSRCNNDKSNATDTLLTITESSDISSPNYDTMDTPELHLQMKKYGLKMQNRKKAIKLLTYMYNELHPTISSFKMPGANAEDINNEDEEPLTKKQKPHTHSSNKDNIIKHESNMFSLKTLDSKECSKRKKTEAVANVGIENVIALNDCFNITEAFTKLLSFNKDLHNSILRYEPVTIELIHCMLKNGGFKCNIKALKEFLDEQCITFRSQEKINKIRARKGK